jgi:O-glycosyl hydrolase
MKIKNLVVIGVMLAVAGIFAACDMEVAPQLPTKPIIAPYISVSPLSASYLTTETPDELMAQVWDWSPLDGSLTYQWFRFDSDSTAAFIAYRAGAPIPGAGGVINPAEAEESENGIMVNTLTLPPDITAPAAGKLYYYYLEVTNTDFMATDTKVKTVRSEIATISYNNPGDVRIPIINRQPSGSDYQFGRRLVIAALSVKAVSPDASAILDYQWYHNTTGEIALDKLTVIPNETDAAYQPTLDRLSAGRNYFFVKITSYVGRTYTPPDADGNITIDFIGNPSTPLWSLPAIIDMEPGETALEPVITRQPGDRVYFPGEIIQALTVVTEPPMDGGTISYQWYQNTIPLTQGGTAISGNAAKLPFYTPDIRQDGTYYYYVVVVNTNPSVKSAVKTAATSSRAVRVVRAQPGQTIANATVTVYDPRRPDRRFQYVRGYGGMDTAWANFPEQKPQDMETMYNPDWGLGYNINRIMISPANTNVNVTIRDLINSHRPYYYENVKIVNKYGGYNLASPWSPPKEWKSNNSINGGGILIPAYRQQYANYLRAFAKNMYDAGAPIYAISISNEPNYTAGYDGCEWTPEEMRDFFLEVNPKPYTKGIRGYGGGRETDRVLIVNGESANTPYINELALQNSVSRANIDLFARHVYGETTKTLWKRTMSGADTSAGQGYYISAIINQNGILHRGDGTMFEVWMTEHNINSANATAYPNDSTWNYIWRFMNDIDLVMRMNNENAFVWWASKRFYSMVGDGQFGTRDGAPLPRGYGLSHYAKYTIDTHRIGLNVTGTFADGTDVGTLERSTSPINSTSFNLDNVSARITAYASIESGKDNKPITTDFDIGGPNENWNGIDYISLVMWTPTTTRGEEGRNLGTVELLMPDGFLIGGVSAHKSWSATNMFVPENVSVSANRRSAFVTLGPSQILSVKLTRQ